MACNGKQERLILMNEKPYQGNSSTEKPYAYHRVHAAENQVLFPSPGRWVHPPGLESLLAAGAGGVCLSWVHHRPSGAGDAFALSPHQAWRVSLEKPLGQCRGGSGHGP